MTTLTQQTPVINNSDSTEDPKLVNNITALLAWANGNIDGTNVDPSLTGRRLIAQAAFFFPNNQGAATYFTGSDGVLQQSSAGTYTKPPVWFYLDPANYAVTGKSNTQLIVRISLSTGSTAPGAVTFAGQLNAVSGIGGTAGTVTPVAGALQGTAASIASPSSSSLVVAECTPFAFPTAGAYAPIVVTNATVGASAVGVTIGWQLFVRNT